MSYQALYRVFRPQIFNDVVGQTHITRTLQNALNQKKFSHAYLFTGPRGTGKTSAAKIFAKAINCEKAPANEPCLVCESCQGIQSGAITDVIEIDAASNNGVEQIRDIRDKVKYAPSAVPFKVYIIDEVHMLSIGAFNALLKTLEEPPKHVIFILATTEPHKIPLTIISRCQRFDFKRISSNEMIGRMHVITDSEQITVDEAAFRQIALSAEGGMRDALSLLDQAISYSDDVVTLEDVLQITGAVSQMRLLKLIKALSACDVSEALKYVDQFVQEGKDPGRLIHDLIYFLRDCLLYQTAPNLGHQLERAIVDDAFIEFVKTLNPSWIQKTIRDFNHCQQEMKWTTSPQIFIEITVLKITEKKEASDPAFDEKMNMLADQVVNLEKELRVLKESKHTSSTKTSEKKAHVEPRKSSYKVPNEQIRSVLLNAQKEQLHDIKKSWQQMLQQLKARSAPAHATLNNAKPVAASDAHLVVAFKYDIHCTLVLDHRELIESMIQNILGRKVTFLAIPENDWISLREKFINEQKLLSDAPAHEDAEHQEDILVTHARKLVGDELIEIHE